MQTILNNRQKGAQKAAETRRVKRQKSLAAVQCSAGMNDKEEWYCGVCKGLWETETAEEESWIECSMCLLWFHYKCEQITTTPPPEVNYICKKCQN